MTPFTVALIGPDGAGKTTISRRLEQMMPRIQYLYMGDNAAASNVALPTTRWIHAMKRAQGTVTGGPPDSERRGAPARGVRGMLRNARSLVGAGNRLAEEWYRQMLAWYYLLRGRIVLFDRHFYSDYFAHDIASNNGDRSMGRRVHGFVLRCVYPKPDLVILLDAPAEVLWARKSEGRFEALVRRREEYLQLRTIVPDIRVVDATQPLDAVVHEISRLILEYAEAEVAGA